MGSRGWIRMAGPDGSTQHDRRDTSLAPPLQRSAWSGAMEGQLSKSSTQMSRVRDSPSTTCLALPLPQSKWEVVMTAWPGALIASTLG